MHEKFLSYLWQHRRFAQENLTTEEGEQIEILHQGHLNHDSGPDYTDARIRIGDTLWAGNVEIHVKASDWLRHRHTLDRAYDNTILHVVHDADTPIKLTTGSEIPCLSLNNRYDADLYARFCSMQTEKRPIACSQWLKDIPGVIWYQWLDRLLIERLEGKTDRIKWFIEQTHGNWDEAFYHALGRNFGQKVNAEPFEALVRSLPMQILAKHKSQLHQIEALLFGQAGMLEEQFTDTYPESLRKEYHFLRHKYSLTPIDSVQWKYFRMRPAGFPTIRIAQFAMLVYQSSHLFSKVMEAPNTKTLELLLTATVSDYWKTHYRFDTEAKRALEKPITKELVQLIIYNTVLPFWFLYGRDRQNPDLEQKALDFYTEMRPETNHLLEEWEQAGKKAKSASEAQAMLQLRTQYCDQKRCTHCAVGVQVLK